MMVLRKKPLHMIIKKPFLAFCSCFLQNSIFFGQKSFVRPFWNGVCIETKGWNAFWHHYIRTLREFSILVTFQKKFTAAC